MLLNRPLSVLRASAANLTSPVRGFLFFILFYAILILIARRRSSHDPGSVFFDVSTSYDLSYSAARLEQASAFVDTGDYDLNPPKGPKAPNLYQPKFCVGIATIARKGVRYLKGTVGALLEGLSEKEREDIHLILFIAHTDPTQHPAYSEPWLHQLADEVLLYNATDVDIDHIRSLETDEAKVAAREKALFDYTYLLKACEATESPYVIMLEDDVVALDGWYHRTIAALSSVEAQIRDMGASKWLYLRLFYTEEFFGWNSEEWPTYLFYSMIVVGAVVSALLVSRHHSYNARIRLPNSTVIVLGFVCTPLLIGLFFASGRMTVLPLPEGVHQMPEFGCCSQAFVFPRVRIPDLVELYTSKHIGYVDMLTEEFANEHNEIRWAITPSVIQHVGRKSSKGAEADAPLPAKPKTKAELTDVEKIWNFGFESNDAKSLRIEHDTVVEHEDI